jgi:hypothetical protein
MPTIVPDVDIHFVLNEIASSRKGFKSAGATFKGTYVWLEIFKDMLPNVMVSLATSAS